jgi:D-hydroxyproline dehydrogenase subunit alpha
MTEAFDLVVVGAGPAGLAAAATAAEGGMTVCLVDDNPGPGGQIWRSSVAAKSSHPASARWLRRIHKSRVEVRSGAKAIAASHATAQSRAALRLERDGVCVDVEFSALILATGARELFLPFPGWTLPGVYGAGGLQAFVKSGFDISGKRVVIAGTGPLLLAVAAYLHQAGARIVTMVEQAPMQRLARFSLALAFGHAGKLVEGAGYAFRTLGIPYRTGAWVTSATGDGRLRHVNIVCGSKAIQIDADMLAIGYHLIPNVELPQLLDCELEHGFVRVDSLQQTSVKDVYCVGEATGIGGVQKAQIEGRIAALAASGQFDKSKALTGSRDRQKQFAASLAATFALRDELRTLAANETVVCRCEDVSHEALASCRSWREAKLHTRCGMGPCQGRVCAPATQFLYGWQAPHPRPPLFPVEVATLAPLPSARQAADYEAMAHIADN